MLIIKSLYYQLIYVETYFIHNPRRVKIYEYSISHFGDSYKLFYVQWNHVTIEVRVHSIIGYTLMVQGIHQNNDPQGMIQSIQVGFVSSVHTEKLGNAVFILCVDNTLSVW